MKVGRKETHGMSYAPLYPIWQAMMTRCYNINTPAYKDYGGRGIEVCVRWHTPVNFIKDMGERPKGFSLDRINNDKGYSPANCRWASAAAQGRNKRNNIMVRLNGKSLCLEDWSRESGINIGTIRNRIKKGWKPTLAVSIQAGAIRKSHRMLTFKGRSMPIGKWSEALGAHYDIVGLRLAHGWPLAKALTQPVNRRTL